MPGTPQSKGISFTPEQPFVQPAVVSVGDVDVTDNDAIYRDQENAANIWTDYMVFNDYHKPQHVYQVPVAAPYGFGGASCAFVQLAAPTLTLTCRWTACRFGQHPTVPDPTPADPNLVLLCEDPTTVMVTLGPGGAAGDALYRISGVYTYGFRNPSRITLNDMAFPVPPWMDAGGLDRSLSPSLYDASLMQPGGQAAPPKNATPGPARRPAP